MSDFIIEINNGLENAPWGTLAKSTGADLAGDKNIINAFIVLYQSTAAKASMMHYRLLQLGGDGKWFVAHAGNSKSVVGTAIDAPGDEMKTYHFKVESPLSDAGTRVLMGENDFKFGVDADAIAYAASDIQPLFYDDRLITITEAGRLVWQGYGLKKKPGKTGAAWVADQLETLEEKKKTADEKALEDAKWHKLLIIIAALVGIAIVGGLIFYAYNHRAEIAEVPDKVAEVPADVKEAVKT